MRYDIVCLHISLCMNDYRADVETLDIYNKREKESAREAEYVVSGLFSGCGTGTGRELLGIGMENQAYTGNHNPVHTSPISTIP